MRHLYGTLFLSSLSLWLTGLQAQPQYENAPVHYSSSEPDDAFKAQIQILNETPDALDRSSDRTLIRDLLKHLNIPPESQLLVFSKTSFQNSLISPEHPRSIFFSKDLYVGWVPGGSAEIIAHDAQLGPIFYLLDLHDETLQPVRTQSCLDCHGGSHTRDIPGMLVRSVFPDKNGHPILSNGSTLVDHSTPLEQRWGGWYVTGDHRDKTHQGNKTFQRHDDGSATPLHDHGSILKSLDGLIDTQPYVTNTSDIVAFMVLEHQITVHNAIEKARLNTRLRLHQNQAIAELLKLGPGELTETSQRVLDGLADNLMDAILFYDELPLPRRVLGKRSIFQRTFEQQAEPDSNGDSLYVMDLEHRLFRFRCSFMIYSQSFADLPPTFLKIFFRKLGAVLLDGRTGDDKYVDIDRQERLAINRILQNTLPEPWRHEMRVKNK